VQYGFSDRRHDTALASGRAPALTMRAVCVDAGAGDADSSPSAVADEALELLVDVAEALGATPDETRARVNRAFETWSRHSI
jgi:hypothetical protein